MSTHIENIENIENAYFNGEKNISLPSNIPSPKGFIGRENDLTALKEGKARGITSFVLHGAGGVGKTDLALEFIRQSRSEDQAFVRIDMQGLSKNALSSNVAKIEVIRAFNPKVPTDLSEQDIDNLYIGLLNEHKPILFFDNAKDREQVEPLNNKSAFILITSRMTFTVSGGLSKTVEQMSLEDACNLLYSIVDKNRFEGEADKLASLAGYLPMALLPLASLLVEDITLKAKKLITVYSDRKERLQLADPNRENLSVEASFDLSYENLSDELKERWRKLSVFPAEFDLDAMQTVWQSENGDKTRSELINKHLLEYNSQTERSRLHDIARDYARERISDGEQIESEFLYCFHYGKLLQTLRRITVENLEKYDTERINIEYGFNWLAKRVEQDDYFAFLGELYTKDAFEIQLIRLHFRELLRWQETGLKAAYKTGNKKHESDCLNNLGIAYKNLGDNRKAIEYYEKALIIQREANDFKGISNCLGNLGNAHTILGEHQKAIEYQEQSLIIAREFDDRTSEAASLTNLGNVYLSLGEYRKAVEYYEKAIPIAKEIKNRLGEEICLVNMGISYDGLGEYQKAIEYQEQALIIARKISDFQGEATISISLANVYFHLEAYEKAIIYLKQSLPISREIGDLSGEGICLFNLGNNYRKLGEKETAKNYFVEAIAILASIQSPYTDTVRQNLTKLEI